MVQFGWLFGFSVHGFHGVHGFRTFMVLMVFVHGLKLSRYTWNNLIFKNSTIKKEIITELIKQYEAKRNLMYFEMNCINYKEKTCHLCNQFQNLMATS